LQALVELGDHLSKSKVKAEELKYSSDLGKDNKWVSDKEIENCQQCSKNFSVSRRRVSSLFNEKSTFCCPGFLTYC